MIRRFYFLGEMGIFVQLALGAFERFFERNPDVQAEVLTYPDYGVILKTLFPDNISSIVAYDGPPLFQHRFGIGLAGDYPRDVDAIVAGYDDISGIVSAAGVAQPLYLAKQPVPNTALVPSVLRRLRAYLFWKRRPDGTPFFPVLPISRPISSDRTEEGVRTVCLLPRFRKHSHSRDRNVDAEFWNVLIAKHLLPSFGDRVRFVLCGLESERVAGLDPQADVIRPGDFAEEVALLNGAALVICPLSGYGQLASFSAAPVLYVLKAEPIDQEASHIASVIQSDIFDRGVTCLREPEILASPQTVVDLINAGLAAREQAS